MVIFKILKSVLFTCAIALFLLPVTGEAFAEEISEEEYGLQLFLLVALVIITTVHLAVDGLKSMLGSKKDKEK